MGWKNEESDLIPERTQKFFLLQNIGIGSGVHPASYAVGMSRTSVPTHIHGMCRNNFTYLSLTKNSL